MHKKNWRCARELAIFRNPPMRIFYLRTVHIVNSFHFNQQYTIDIFILTIYYKRSNMFRYICFILREFQLYFAKVT